jgi:hypothetical protein
MVFFCGLRFPGTQLLLVAGLACSGAVTAAR